MRFKSRGDIDLFLSLPLSSFYIKKMFGYDLGKEFSATYIWVKVWVDSGKMMWQFGYLGT